MRERRHLSGSSNANQQRPVSAVSPRYLHLHQYPPSVSLATSPRNQALEAVLSSPSRKEVAISAAAASAVSKSGSTTARRPVVAAETVERQRPKRRIQSARGSSERQLKCDPEDVNQIQQSLPKLNLQASAACDEGVSRAQNGSQVQWAIKVNESQASSSSSSSAKSTPSQVRSEGCPPQSNPKELDEFCDLLRDRYDGKRSLRVAFLNWDRDKDGRLCGKEVREMIKTLGFASRLGLEKVEGIIQHIGTLPSSSLRYEDFCGFIYGRPDVPASNGGTTSSSTKPSIAPQEATRNPVLGSDQALYPDVNHVLNILRKKYASRKFRKVFRDWDVDKDGCITMNELDNNLRRQGVRLVPDQVKELFDTYDGDQDGRLQYSEFVKLIFGPVQDLHGKPTVHARIKEQAELHGTPHDPFLILRNSALEKPVGVDEDVIRAAVQRKIKAFAPRINDAYAAFDDDHSGNLSYSELRQGLKQLGLQFTDQEFRCLAQAVDTDGSGEISYKEFSNLFNQKPGLQNETSGGGTPLTHTTPETPEKDKEARPKAATFDFTHLSRHAERNSDGPAPSRFVTETQLYGSGQQYKKSSGASQSHSSSSATATLGQEEKQRKNANFMSRLHRIRAQQQDYDAKTDHLHDAYDKSQERRAQTLHKHQQRYSQSIEEQRPLQRQASPSPLSQSHAKPGDPFNRQSGK